MVFNNCFWFYVAEQSKFFFHFIRNVFFAAAYQDIWLNTNAAQFFYAVLCRFSFQLACCIDIRHQCYVNVKYIITTYVFFHLADSFHEWQAFNITYSTADFSNNYICVILFTYAVYVLFDFICNMWNYLYSAAQVITFTFFIDYRPVHFTCCNVGTFTKVNIDKAFIVTQIKVSFSTVICYEYFTVLVRAHRTRVNINVWVKFLNRYIETAVFKQATQGCCCNPFTKRRNNAASYENILSCHDASHLLHFFRSGNT